MLKNKKKSELQTTFHFFYNIVNEGIFFLLVETTYLRNL